MNNKKLPRSIKIFFVIVLVIAIFIFAIQLVTGNYLKSEFGVKKSGESTDREIIFLRSIQNEYEIASAKKIGSSESDRGCKDREVLFGKKITTCYKQLFWRYEGHEVFEDLDQLAKNKNMELGDYYGKAGNSKYYLGQNYGRKVCFHIYEHNDSDGNLSTNVVLATGVDDICKTKSE